VLEWKGTGIRTNFLRMNLLYLRNFREIRVNFEWGDAGALPGGVLEYRRGI